MPILRIRPEQFETLGLAVYSARLHRFVTRYVKLPAPVSPETLTKLLRALQPLAKQHGFDSEADFALYAVVNLCFPEKASAGELDASLADPRLPVSEKRYRWSVELDQGGFMPFGTLELDHEDI